MRFSGDFLVFAFGLTEYRDVRVSIFPGDEEIVVGFQALLTLPLHGIGPSETELRQWNVDVPPSRATMAEEFLQLCGGFGGLSCRQVSFREVIIDVQACSIWEGRGEQICGLDGVSSRAFDIRAH